MDERKNMRHFAMDEDDYLRRELTSQRPVDEGVVRWTPVAEQLPETDKLVLVVKSDGDMAVAVWNAALGWLHYWSGSRVKNVTHWMPLPELPKQEEEE